MVLAIFNYYKTGDLKYFYYADLSYFHHPTYMALFGGAALIYLYLSLLDPSKVKTFYFKSGLSKFALISVISIFTLLLMSKAGILFALLINSIGIVAIFKSRQKLMQAFLIVSGLFLIVIGAYLTIKPLESRVNEAWSSITESGPKESSTGARILAWETSWQIIKQAPVFGVGTGDLSDELDQIYLEKGYNKLYEKSLNSHSQFFETWGKSGFIGLLSLIGLFIYAFTKIENYFYLLIALLIWSNMLMESMLQIQSGIVFIAFINSLFATAIINQKT